MIRRSFLFVILTHVDESVSLRRKSTSSFLLELTRRTALQSELIIDNTVCFGEFCQIMTNPLTAYDIRGAFKF